MVLILYILSKNMLHMIPNMKHSYYEICWDFYRNIDLRGRTHLYPCAVNYPFYGPFSQTRHSTRFRIRGLMTHNKKEA